MIEGGVFLDSLIQQRTAEISTIEAASSADDQAQKELLGNIREVRMKLVQWLGPLESKDPWLARAVKGYMPAMQVGSFAEGLYRIIGTVSDKHQGKIPREVNDHA